MDLSPIKTEEDYEAALKEAEWLFDVDDSHIELERMEFLFKRIEAYEDKYYSISSPSLVSKILYFLESRGFLHR